MDVGRSLVDGSPLGFAVAFGAGMVSFLSPCVLPLVPGYLAMMSGLGTAELAEATARPPAAVGAGAVAIASRSTQSAARRRVLRATLRATLAFVAGFTAVFVAFYAAATAVADVLFRNQEVITRVAGVVVVVMGLVVAGLVSPRALSAERRLRVSPARLGAWAPPVMGAAFAFGWTPCIGPVLSAVLAVAASEDTVARGLGLLLAYSLGLGVPFVAAGLALGRIAGALDWAKRHFRAVQLVSGLALAAFGLLLLTDDVTRLSGWFSDVMTRLGLERLTQS